MDDSAIPPEESPEVESERADYESLPELHNLDVPCPVSESGLAARPSHLPVIVMGIALTAAAIAIGFLWADHNRLQAKIDQLRHPAVVVAPPELAVVSATYGSGQQFADVTVRARDVLTHPESDFYAHPNWLGADPTPGWNKQLIVTYEYKGQRHIFTTGEGGKVNTEMLRTAATP